MLTVLYTCIMALHSSLYITLKGKTVCTLLLQIVSEFRCLQSRSYYLRVNHSALLHGVLSYCGVPDDLHADVCGILGDTKVWCAGSKVMIVACSLLSPLMDSDTLEEN